MSSHIVRQVKSLNKKKNASEWVKQVKCERTGYENTSTQARPIKKDKKTIKRKIVVK